MIADGKIHVKCDSGRWPSPMGADTSARRLSAPAWEPQLVPWRTHRTTRTRAARQRVRARQVPFQVRLDRRSCSSSRCTSPTYRPNARTSQNMAKSPPTSGKGCATTTSLRIAGACRPQDRRHFDVGLRNLVPSVASAARPDQRDPGRGQPNQASSRTSSARTAVLAAVDAM